MDGEKYVHQLILSAKIGSEQDFKELWKAHKFVLDSIFLNLCNLYPVLERRRVEIYHFMYSWFWEAIEEHNFSKNDPFCYNLKKKIIYKMQQYLKENCQMPEELIINEDDLRKTIKKEISSKNKKLHYGLRSLTVKQLQAVWYYIYEGKNLDQCAKKIGITERSLRDRLNMSYKKISEIAIGVKTKNKKKIFSEKIYVLPR